MLAEGFQKDTEQANSHILCDESWAKYPNRKEHQHRHFAQSYTDVTFIYHQLVVLSKEKNRQELKSEKTKQILLWLTHGAVYLFG